MASHDLHPEFCRWYKNVFFHPYIFLPGDVIHIITKTRLRVFKGKGLFKQKEISSCLILLDND